ncbi:MAG: uroporphyrinogen decarboxylase [Henriciella sp.]|nr:uroporphyrinogen decarboxylase [Henriciella sp.]
MAETPSSRFLQVLSGTPSSPVPIWMMRQAGRHLPEYLELRAQAKDFLDFCYSPSMAAEATLQPIRRYDMDAAILFADILLILDAIGLDVRFEKGVGPIVETVNDESDLNRVPMEKAVQRLSPVYETVDRVRSKLDSNKALIGFCGAPWTVALYAIEGRGGTDKSTARSWAYTNADLMNKLLDLLIEASAQYLSEQVKAGADALMIFESWAEGLPSDLFQSLVVEPNARLVNRLREMDITVPIIGFPRGAATMLEAYTSQVAVNGVGLDTAINPAHVAGAVPNTMAVQGHLDPLLLIAGGDAMDARVRELLQAYSGRPHIFNLGHGVRPETPIAHVERVVELVREGAT